MRLLYAFLILACSVSNASYIGGAGGLKATSCTPGEFFNGVSSGALTCATPAGGGNVTGAASSVTHHLAGFGDTSGTLLEDSGVAAANVALLTGSQTIAGVKTFSSAPIISALTASTVPYLDSGKALASSAVTPTELGYVSGVTSALQTQLNAKASSTLTSAHLLVGNGSNVATDVAASGDLTLANTGAFTIGNNKITLAKMATQADQTILGNTSGGAAVPVALTATQATAILNAMVGDSGSGGTKGLAPAPGSGDAAAGKFLKANGTWAVPAGGGGSPGGSDTQVQFNDGGSFGGDSNFTWDKTNHYLSLGGATVSSTHPWNFQTSCANCDFAITNTNPAALFGINLVGDAGGFGLAMSVYNSNNGNVGNFVSDSTLTGGLNFQSDAGPLVFTGASTVTFNGPTRKLLIDGTAVSSPSAKVGSLDANGFQVTGAGGSEAADTTIMLGWNGASSSMLLTRAINTGTGGMRDIMWANGGGDSFTNWLDSANDAWAAGIHPSDHSFKIAPDQSLSNGNEDLSIAFATGAVTLGAPSTTPQHALNTSTGTTGADVLTLTNGVTGTAGNPTGYIKITVNGSANHYIPYW